MIQRPLRLSFTGGEISPWAASRVDLDLFTRSASRIENFIVTPFGGLSRRPGFQYIDNAARNTGEIRLIPFQYSTGDAFVLEITPYLIRFFYKGALLRKADGSPYTLATPWPSPRSLHVKQINDVMYFCTNTHPPMRLERYSTLNWALKDISWKYIPWRHASLQGTYLSFTRQNFLNEGRAVYALHINGFDWKGNYEGSNYVRISTLLPDRNVWLNGGYLYNMLLSMATESTLAKAGTVYTEGWRIYYIDAAGYAYFYTCKKKYVYNAATSTTHDPAMYPDYFQPGIHVGESFYVEGSWEFRTTGTWKGEFLMQKSFDDGQSWLNVRSCYSEEDSNFIVNGDERDDPCQVRLSVAKMHPNSMPTMINLRIISHKVDHIFSLTGQASSSGTWYARLLTDYSPGDSGATRDWSLSAFGSKYGYPGAMTWHQNRLVFAGTPTQPQTLWISRTDDYHNFRLGANDSDAMELTIAAGSQNKIQWIHSRQKLFLGTSEGEWTLDSADGRALTPSNACFICHSHQGGEAHMALPMESSLLFVQRGARNIRELSYNINNDGYATSDLTLFAEHISDPGITDLCLFHDDQQRLWIVKSDGEAAGMTWIPSQNILAWNRNILRDALFLAVTAIYNGAQHQELWAVVERQTASGTMRSVERLSARETLPAAGITMTAEETPVYLDSWSRVEPTEAGTLTGLSHLAGCSVAAYPGHCPHKAVYGSVSDQGAFTLPEGADPGTWTLGVPYQSLVTTTPFDYLETAGQLKNHISTQISLLHSHPGMEYSSSAEGEWYRADLPVPYSETGGISASPTRYYSGYTLQQQAVLNQQSPCLRLRTDEPHPLNILSIIPLITFQEDQ